MPIIKLTHLKRLGYTGTSKKTAPRLPAALLAAADQGALLVTFRPLHGRRPDRHMKRLHAAERFSSIAAERLLLCGLETDSPLAPLILWDLAHAAALGSTITLIDDLAGPSYLQRSYFREGLELLEQSAGKLVFRKAALLGAERDGGLDAWTFGIPVGPEDATLLNATVKRILELDVPRKEILLCGRPGPNFLYGDQVRIVGEDITAPPVLICAKKNRLAEEAQYPNLCILHDRVFLPKDFYNAMRKYGDNYPLTTFQSVYFDDKCNLVPRRYSDFGVSHRVRSMSTKGLMRDNDVDKPSEFAPSVLARTESAGFYPGHAMRYNTSTYATGSLYICKRSVWLLHPQNENMRWIEFEDLEHGYRLSDNGVPSRINPYGLTQSLISRPLLSRAVGTFIENAKGQAQLYTPWSEMLPIPRKPAIKLSQEAALASMRRFSEQYVPTTLNNPIPVAAVFRSNLRLASIVDIVSRASVPYQAAKLGKFLDDFEKHVIFDQLPFAWKEHVYHDLVAERGSPVQSLVFKNDALVNHAALRPRGSIFYASLHDYLQPRSIFTALGTLLSGVYLFFKRRHVVYLKGGPLAYCRALSNSTPFVDYGK